LPKEKKQKKGHFSRGVFSIFFENTKTAMIFSEILKYRALFLVAQLIRNISQKFLIISEQSLLHCGKE
jgi:hypothetical protein